MLKLKRITPKKFRNLSWVEEREIDLRTCDAIDRLIARFYRKTSGWKIVFRPLYWIKLERLICIQKNIEVSFAYGYRGEYAE